MLAALALAAGLTAIPALGHRRGQPFHLYRNPRGRHRLGDRPPAHPDPGESAAPPSSQEPPSSSSQEPTARPAPPLRKSPRRVIRRTASPLPPRSPAPRKGPRRASPPPRRTPGGGESESGGSSSEEPVIEPTEEPWQPSDSQSSDPYQGGTTTDAHRAPGAGAGDHRHTPPRGGAAGGLPEHRR